MRANLYDFGVGFDIKSLTYKVYWCKKYINKAFEYAKLGILKQLKTGPYSWAV